MPRLLACAVTAGLLVAGAPAARAHPAYHYRGGCSFVMVQDPTREAGWWAGLVVLDAVATYVDGVPAPLAPIQASCDLVVNGNIVVSPVAGASGIGAAVGTPSSVAFTAGRNDVVQVCEHVVVGGEAHGVCKEAREPALPQPVRDFLDALWAVTDPIPLDPMICPVLAAFAPGADPVRITVEGDLYVGGTLVWSCPPYGADEGAGGPIRYAL